MTTFNFREPGEFGDGATVRLPGSWSHANHRNEGMSDLMELLERVKTATGPLDNRTALELHVLGYGKLTNFEPVVDRDEYGGWALTYQMDAKGGGRQKCTMPEDRLPDRNIDAAIALVERKLPGWAWYVQKIEGVPSRAPIKDCEADLWVPGAKDAEIVWDGPRRFRADGATVPLAIIAALLSALTSGASS